MIEVSTQMRDFSGRNLVSPIGARKNSKIKIKSRAFSISLVFDIWGPDNELGHLDSSAVFSTTGTSFWRAQRKYSVPDNPF
jgi:hypothetical protein